MHVGYTETFAQTATSFLRVIQREKTAQERVSKLFD